MITGHGNHFDVMFEAQLYNDTENIYNFLQNDLHYWCFMWIYIKCMQLSYSKLLSVNGIIITTTL